eukprot:m.22950 g.22950  ORF g.22950 m.22950 type:complete len:291 (-) comp7452_c0_seq2:383-1255(-)
MELEEERPDTPGSDPEGWMDSFLPGFNALTACESDEEDEDAAREARFKHRPKPRGWVPTFEDMVDRKQDSFQFEIEAKDSQIGVVEVEVGHRTCNGDAATASSVWDSAIVLTRYLEGKGRPYIRGKTILELGAGTGLVGLVAAALGARAVVLSDLDEAIPGIQRNIERQHGMEKTRSLVQTCKLAWGRSNTEAYIKSYPESFDTILVADCLLPGATNLFPLLAETLDVLLAPNSKGDIIFAYEERMDCSEFWEMLTKLGFQVSVIKPMDLHTKYQADQIHVLRIFRQPST